MGGLTAGPPVLDAAVEHLVSDWESNGKVARLWSGDASLWTGVDEDRWLGWLQIASAQLRDLRPLRALQQETASGAFDHALLLGMGGSSLCPDVLRLSFGNVAGAPKLHVLDSTDPAQVRSVEDQITLDRTLFIVSSKSGTTLEPNIFQSYFFDRVQKQVGTNDAGARFIAVTDPGSKLEQLANTQGFRHVFYGLPSIGGRYSALSHFGMVPASVMGLDIERLLSRAEAMQTRCTDAVPLRENPGAMLGLTLGAAARLGRDKVTITASPGVRDFGGWLEQLLAESTGKRGMGLIPVEGEALGQPSDYGTDRIFVYLRDESAPETLQDQAVAQLEDTGLPVIRVGLQDRYDLGGEFFRWEFATAVIGAVLQINPYDQPDVEASKVETRRLTDRYETDGRLPPEVPLVRAGQLEAYADAVNARALGAAESTVDELVAAQCAMLGEGDYLAILAYVEMSASHQEVLQRLRHAVRDSRGVATCVGFGPRFLHSTGQAYKGGPNTGVFLQITCADTVDLPVPGRRYSFGVVKAAQARGDFEVLSTRARRALRLHVTGDPLEGLRRIATLVEKGLTG